MRVLNALLRPKQQQHIDNYVDVQKANVVNLLSPFLQAFHLQVSQR